MRAFRFSRLVASLLILGLVSVACGSAADDASVEAAPTATTAAPEPTAVPTEVPAPAPTPTEVPDVQEAAATSDTESSGTESSSTESGATSDDVAAAEAFDDDELLIGFIAAIFGVSQAEMGPLQECISQELDGAGISVADASALGGSVLVAALRCDVPYENVFSPTDLVLEGVEPATAQCTTDEFVGWLRNVPYNEADAVLDAPIPADVIETISSTCGMDAALLESILNG